MKKRKIIIINRKRALTFYIIALFTVLSVVFNAFGVNSVEGKQKDTFTTHIVGKGETIWSIADAYNCSNNDIRSFIYEIEQANGLCGNFYIYPGQELTIPR